MIGNLSRSRFANLEVEHLLKKLEADEKKYDAELRNLDRKKLVFPVTISTDDEEIEIDAFSRNLSPEGVSLITPQPFSAGSELSLGLHVHGKQTDYIAECRWCETFGEVYWKSGWKIKSGVVDVDAIRDADANVAWDRRSTEREKFAIPVIVNQKGDQPRIQGFTRNVSGGGVNLVINKPIPENQFCLLEFVSTGDVRYEIVAESVWCRKFGKNYYLTGWQFPKLERIGKFHEAFFKK